MRYALAWTALAAGLAAVQWRLEAAVALPWLWGARGVAGYGVLLSVLQAGNYYAYAAGGDPASWLRRSGNPMARLILAALWPYARVARVLNVLATIVMREDRCNTVAPNLVIGSAPTTGHRRALEQAGVDAVCNVCFEFPGLLGPMQGRDVPHHDQPFLDAVAPPLLPLQAAVDWVVGQRTQGRTVLVHCAQGHGRSATVCAAVIVRMGDAVDVDAAVALLTERRPGVHLRDPHRVRLAELVATTPRPR
jgi:diacylglycerol kinase (ATP)